MPDFDRLREIAAEMEALIASGKWNEAEYKRLRAEAVIASAGEDELLEFIDNESEEDW